MATLTRETSPEPGLGIGRIDATLLASALAKLPHAPKLTFICGANAFVETAADLPVGLGIPPERIRTERYGG